ncbi:prolyl-tRNA editing enzyme YbaK/EbsC (Cys-tRNA(Pro) deacylase) [Paenochrobactrum gallinarii]|uniref:Prolyl-tRNA editing enzyme YbaK/EbsC (Cys-tRNA(Pro) deacylase) n=1 Tax=Paenochrobactrum gallinarii TaxID=643673 RepID=A0A841LVW3_9HYPH|nr:YbaK/EbsC family protein [Paenochrobactrum gallinarii]MBB6262505.1 prolyl-tRNA editing enzyme YbaK/EbsC (Cys-tRNA(Pro) deacylase) [Paenochrobactrum gallinarii]
MSLESVKAFFAKNAPDLKVIELETSTATVPLAAEAHGVEPGQIAKTLSFKVKDDAVLIVTRGDARIDNRKFKDQFATKPRMLDAGSVIELTGHPVGGVCPFGLASDMAIYCDISLKAYEEVVPAAGSINSAVRVNTERLAALTNAQWIDVCQ